MGWHTTMRRAKAKHRPDLDDWECDGLFEVFPSFVNGLSEDYEAFIPSQQHNQSCSSPTTSGTTTTGANRNSTSTSNATTINEIPEDIPVVIDATTLTVSQFARDYESHRVPAVIRNIPNGHDGGVTEAAEPWPALDRWSFWHLERDPELRERAFKCGEDDDGNSIKIKLKHFFRYLQNNHDDSPLYIFDSAFEDDKVSKKLLRDYKVPSYFREDLFRLCSESRRPPYRWFLVGPERSGTSVHIDPLATSAWNTLIHGQKRWVLFPPHVPKSIVKGKDLIRDDEDDEPIHYFMYILPRIKRKAAAACFGSATPSNSDYKDFACYEFTQNPGETVFVPNGWWHAVLNLTHTVGITQNFCSARNFDEVWMKTRTGRKRLAWKWLCQLEQRYPHLAKRAKALNQRDKFIMKYDPVVMEYVRKATKINMYDKRRKNSLSSDDDDDDDDDEEEEEEERKEGEEKDGDNSLGSHRRPSKCARQPKPLSPPLATNIRLPSYHSTIKAPEVTQLDRSWKRTREMGTGSTPVTPPS